MILFYQRIHDNAIKGQNQTVCFMCGDFTSTLFVSQLASVLACHYGSVTKKWDVRWAFSCHLSIRLAGNVPVNNHFPEIRPEDADPLGQGQRDAHRSLQAVLHRHLPSDGPTSGLIQDLRTLRTQHRHSALAVMEADEGIIDMNCSPADSKQQRLTARLDMSVCWWCSCLPGLTNSDWSIWGVTLN